jgi:DMSO reductase family type II enzyme chaperone
MKLHDQTLARTQIYHLLAWAFRYPEEETLQALAEKSASLAEWLETLNGTGPLREAGQAFATAVRSASTAELGRAYNGLFTGRKPCRLDESEYEPNPFTRTHRMADAAGFYQAFGMQPAESAGQRPDFIGTELEFMYLLLLKEMYAEEKRWEEQAAICREAQARFFHEHLAWWVPQLCDKLEAASSCAYYRTLATFLKAFIEAEKAHFPTA